MAKTVNKVILLGNVGKDPKSDRRRAVRSSQTCPWQPANGTRIKVASGRSGRSGTTLWAMREAPRFCATM